MKKIIIQAADYELYRFFMPWKCLFAREENRFILGELEKQHPRFSSDCCYDAKYSLKKKQVLAEVVVMEKANLAQYKNAGGALFIEENARRRVFSGKTRLMQALTLLLIMLAGLLSYRIARKILYESEMPVIEKSEDFIAEENADGGQEIDGAEKVMTDFFTSVSVAGGKVSSFAYGGGKCTFSIYGCHTENVASARYCVVSFKDNEPYFDLEIPYAERNQTNAGNAIVGSKIVRVGIEDEGEKIALVRKQLLEYGAKIESEHNGENTADFSFSIGRNRLYSALKICGEGAQTLGWKEKSFSLSESAGNCLLKVSFSKGEESDFSVMEHLARYSYLFGKEEEKVIAKKSKFFEIAPARKLINPSEVEIGKITKKDGSVLICFKNVDGKISYRKEAGNAR